MCAGGSSGLGGCTRGDRLFVVAASNGGGRRQLEVKSYISVSGMQASLACACSHGHCCSARRGNFLYAMYRYGAQHSRWARVTPRPSAARRNAKSAPWFALATNERPKGTRLVHHLVATAMLPLLAQDTSLDAFIPRHMHVLPRARRANTPMHTNARTLALTLTLAP
jgi:hypothetical protein